MYGAENKRGNKEHSFHLVFICDESGILDAFKSVKTHLVRRRGIALSLIYVIPENILNPLFVRELSILERRFPNNLFISILKIKPREYDYMQEYIEAVINSNTLLNMQFSIFGDAEFVSYVSGILEFLNNDTYSIESKVI